ncbi:hypothetical protein Y032_0034g2919 [Ancylostoma ceylanicum]|uniref:Tyrosine-protein phosphatase domain-containing protein n=1 Tax=Ancylostoma ceylanicum TaxID=53326 RepID=A0A016UN62_9BILA|nr:hypothetical protein Y032_0034g2919 [Ancylostoma ceylanicum]
MATKMISPDASALPEPAVGEPDSCGKTDLPARTALARDRIPRISSGQSLFVGRLFRDRRKKQQQTGVVERSISAEARAKPAPPKVVKKDFIPNAYHEDVVEEAMAQQKKVQSILMHQKQASDTDGAKSSSIQTTDNRATWAQNLIAKRPIRALAKEFAANKKIKPTDFTTEAYEKNDAKNRYNDIICIDATRVILKERPPDDDYIHASWMTMPDGQKYICTQVVRIHQRIVRTSSLCNQEHLRIRRDHC